MNILLFIIPSISLLCVCSIIIGVVIWQLGLIDLDWNKLGTSGDNAAAGATGSGATSNTILSKFPQSFNIIGLYTVDSFDKESGVWEDRSPAGNNLTVTNGVIDRRYVTGTTNSVITFPENILPPKYTFGYIAKYNGPAKKRIFTGKNSNWLSGFWSGQTGVAHHHEWITLSSSELDNNLDIIAVDTNNTMRTNKTPVTLDTIQQTPLLDSANINVNDGILPGRPDWDKEKSDWAIRVMVIYDKQLEQIDQRALEYSLFHETSDTRSSYTL